MSDEANVPRRKKSRRKMRRITVPGDDVPRAASLEEDVDLDDHDDEADVLLEGQDDDEDDGGFDDEPTDPNVMPGRGDTASPNVAGHTSVLPPEGGSIRHDGVVVQRSRIISDRPAPPSLLPPPPMVPGTDVESEAIADARQAYDDDLVVASHSQPSAVVRTKTPPPPPAASIMIAEEYAQEVDEVMLRRQADDVLPPSLRPSSMGARPSEVSNRPPPPAPSSAQQGSGAQPSPSAVVTTAEPPRVPIPPSIPEPTTGPRQSVRRSKPEPSMKPAPPPRKILTPIPPAISKAPPPPPKEQPGAKRPPAWWKTFFSDDYLRSVILPTPQQVKRQCDFVEAVLGLPRGATILDVGCGTGLHAIELTERGYLVVGLDLSLPMITRAAEEAQYRNLRINFLHTDIREIQFDGAFDAVICLGTTFGFFDDDSNRNVLGRLRDALKPGGRLLLDVVNRDYVIQTQPNLVWFQGDGCVCMEETDFNYFTSRLHVKRTMMHEDGRQSEAEYSIRLYSLHELGQLLTPLGFRVIEVSGHSATRGVFFGGASGQVIALAERRGARTDGEPTGKSEAIKAQQRPSKRPAAVDSASAKQAPQVTDSSDDLTDLVEEESTPSTVPNAFDDDDATDPTGRIPSGDDT